LTSPRSPPSRSGQWPFAPTCPLGADAFEQDAGRFVVRVLRHELALERALQDRLAQPLGTLQVSPDDGFEFVNNRQAALDLLNNAVLLGRGR
jgi:hypothetical protein